MDQEWRPLQPGHFSKECRILPHEGVNGLVRAGAR
jgi:hypothetical protein